MKGRRIRYTDDEMAWLEANRTLVISDYHRAFCEAFPNATASMANLHALRKRKGWKVGRAPGRTAGRHWRFSPVEAAWLRQNCSMVLSDYHRNFCAEFGRHDVTPDNLHGLRKRKGWKTGRTGQFAKGQEPPNKGRTCPEGTGGRHPNARKTQFQKGSRTGRAALNHKPIGAERIHPSGYIERKIHDGLPMQSRWRFVHLIEWEAINGPVPSGHCLKCLDDNKRNTAPSNWQLIPRGVLPRLNGGRSTRVMAYDGAPAELKPVLMTVARLEHQARQLRRRKASA